MSKFNQRPTSTWQTEYDVRMRRGGARAPRLPDAATHEGGLAYSRDQYTELFLLGAGGFIAEKAFYETADQRVDRFAALVRGLAVTDPIWLFGFLRWLRTGGNIRTAPIVGAAEAVKVRLQKELDGWRADAPPVADPGLSTDPAERDTPLPLGDERDFNRAVIDTVCQRADEPGELLAYWMNRYGRAVPKPIKRGLADAQRRLYTEYAMFKYDSADTAVRFADALRLTHSKPTYPRDLPGGFISGAMIEPGKVSPLKDAVFGLAVDRRAGVVGKMDYNLSPLLGMAHARRELLSLPVNSRRAVLISPEGTDRLREAGLTWEAVAGWLQGPMDREVWEALIPIMGLFALVRNLRNFDQAGVSDAAAQRVIRRLTSSEQIAKSRMLPMRFYQANLATSSLRWQQALETALSLSTSNIPQIPGRTLVLVDTSGSMTHSLSAKSEMTYLEAGALFGVALTVKNRNSGGPGDSVDLYGFAGGRGTRATFHYPVDRGASVLRAIDGFKRLANSVGYGTEIVRSIQETYRRGTHDRIVIISDMQSFYEGDALIDRVVPPHVPVYGFNLAGYANGVLSGGRRRYDLGGLTDQTFSLINAIESGEKGQMPWETLETQPSRNT